MEIDAFKVDKIVPPQDDLYAKIRASALTLEEHDVVAVSSKVVAIHEGRCMPRAGTAIDALVEAQSDQYLDRAQTPGGFVVHTITKGMVIPNAGIDPFGDYYVLWPEDPKRSAETLLAWLKKEYRREHLYVILTDSRSVLLRRGVVGMAIAWAGFEPLYDNRERTDLMGAASSGSQTNIPDSLAAAAVFVMGEANEGTPIARIRNAPYIARPQTRRKDAFNTFEFGIEEDIFAPFMKDLPWKKGGEGKGDAVPR